MDHTRKQLEVCAQCDAPTWCWITDQGPICGACRVVNFYTRILYAPIGFALMPWQREVLRDLYGRCDADTGRRRYRRSYLEVGKKNGKSFLLGGLPLYHLIVEADEIMMPKVYGAAAAKDQASITFAAAQHLVKNSRFLQDRLKVLPSTRRIVRRDGHGFYAVLSADGDLQDGIEPSLALIDELHRFRTKKAATVREVMIAGTISREEPLTIEITTAGDEYESPLWYKQHSFAKRVIAGAEKSDHFYPRIWACSEEKLRADPEYWKTREARVDANPSHEDRGGFLKDAAILAMLDELGEPGYKRYHLNIAGQKAEQWMPMDAWLKCSKETRPLTDRECWVGIDLSKTTDLTSVVCVFPDTDGSLDILPFFWVPKDRIREITKQTHQDIQKWVDGGLIIATDGPVVDYGVVRKKVDWIAEVFRLQEICFDPWNASHFVQGLIDDGYRCVEIKQGPAKLSPAMKFLMDKVLLEHVRHSGHEVLSWNADCTTVHTDLNGNIKPAKDRLERDGKRIDGISALVTALAQYAVLPRAREWDGNFVAI